MTLLSNNIFLTGSVCCASPIFIQLLIQQCLQLHSTVTVWNILTYVDVGASMTMEWGNVTVIHSCEDIKVELYLKQYINTNFNTLLFRMVGEYCRNLKSLLVRECHYVTERSLGCLRNRIFIDKPDHSEYYRVLDHPVPIMGLNM